MTSISEQSSKYILKNLDIRNPTIENLKVFIDLGGDINIKDTEGNSLMDLAFRNHLNNSEVITFLNEKGLHIGDVFRHCEIGNINFVKEFIDQGNNVNSLNDKQKTLLHKAAKYGHLEIVKFLVSKNINIDQLDKYNDNAIIKAVQRGHLEIVKFLINNKSDPTIEGNTCQSAKSWCETTAWIDRGVKNFLLSC
jgi:ankyrin repeat protein